MAKPRRMFTPEYKAEVVQWVLEGGKSLGQVARDLDLTESAVRTWVHKARATARPPVGAGLHSEEREGLLRQGIGLRSRFMEAEKAQFPITVMSQVLNVSPSGYHAWRRRPESRRAGQDRQLLAEIRAVHQTSRQTYGSPRVHAELRTQDRPVGRHRVARLMRQSGLQARRRRRYRQTTISQHPHPIADNVLKRWFTVEHPNRAWVANITYLWTLEGWLYLSVILDLYSWRVIGWAMGPRIDTALALRALHMALANRPVGAGLIHPSDQGSQYASRAYRAVLAAQGITSSMSRAGDCWDNAVAESCFATLKVEGLQQTVFPTRAAGAASDF